MHQFSIMPMNLLDPSVELPEHAAVTIHLAARLSAVAPRDPDGWGIGMSNAAAELLPSAWVAGLHAAQDVADYLCFNLSARAYRHLLSPDHLALLLRAFGAVVAERDRHCRVPLALKLPLGATDAFPLTLAEAAADAGFDAVTAVLPEQSERLDRLHALALRLRGRAANGGDGRHPQRRGCRGCACRRSPGWAGSYTLCAARRRLPAVAARLASTFSW